MKQNSSVPAFLSKLWALLEDSGTDQLVSWSRNGTCFQVSNEGRFAKEILPLYFKHSNMPSFIRQLNMYGFHKVVLVDGRLPRDLDDVIEFQHPYFRQGEAPLLENIKRKVSVSRTDDVKLKQQEVSKILSEVRQMKGKQDLTDNRILAIKRENEALWNEISSLKQKQLQQHQVIRKIVHFIATMVQSNSVAGIKRKMPLMISTSGGTHSYAKYSRPITMDASQDPTAVHGIPKCETCEKSSVYPGRVIISDITDLDTDQALGELPSFEPSAAETLFSGDIETPSLAPGAGGPTFTSHDLYDAFLHDSCHMSDEEMSDRSELMDHPDMIDSSLAQIHSSLSNAQLNINLDLLRELFSPSSGGSVTAYADVGAHTQEAMAGEWELSQRVGHEGALPPAEQESGERTDGSYPREEEEEEEGVDMLPTLLELAQEAGAGGSFFPPTAGAEAFNPPSPEQRPPLLCS
ncbi:heat shock factor protein 2 [Callorhinchus milii]|uniref:heat shock factor protein 2 n=1 Tax=Callorhinchus milii TaxID=7868 RepID=UPI0004575B5B|nr:heat shock factor protein 2 [Callorhinchus milii]|eukprot:gi/632936132/ref/XP_007892511.1/ PREDICTED: heat shock factor protein 2-like [Callorhinchus milii]